MDSGEMCAGLTALSIRRRIVFTAILALCAVSCRVQRPITTSEESETVIREVVRDSIIKLPADSAWLKAWLECDSAGNVLMQSLSVQQGDRTQVKDIRLSPVAGSGGEVKRFTLSALYLSDSLNLQIKLRDREIERLQSRVEMVTVERRLTWWQNGLITLGACAFAAILLVLGIIIAKLFVR